MCDFFIIDVFFSLCVLKGFIWGVYKGVVGSWLCKAVMLGGDNSRLPVVSKDRRQTFGNAYCESKQCYNRYYCDEYYCDKYYVVKYYGC